MTRKTATLAVVGLGITLGGCSVVDEGLWPVVMGDDPEPVKITRTEEPLPVASAPDPISEITGETLRIVQPSPKGSV